MAISAPGPPANCRSNFWNAVRITHRSMAGISPKRSAAGMNVCGASKVPSVSSILSSTS